jgi:hypothetical protein
MAFFWEVKFFLYLGDRLFLNIPIVSPLRFGDVSLGDLYPGDFLIRFDCSPGCLFFQPCGIESLLSFDPERA